MKPSKKINPLTQIGLSVEQEALEFKRRRMKEELDKLAAESRSEAVSPPGGRPLSPGEELPTDPHDDGR